MSWNDFPFGKHQRENRYYYVLLLYQRKVACRPSPPARLAQKILDFRKSTTPEEFLQILRGSSLGVSPGLQLHKNQDICMGFLQIRHIFKLSFLLLFCSGIFF